MGLFRSPEGVTVEIPDDQAGHFRDQGYVPVSTEQRGEELSSEAVANRHAGVLGGITAGVTSLASGATLGASDALLAGIGSEGSTEDLREARAAHPYISGAGQLVGSILPAFVAPESLLGRTPAGFLARGAAEASEAARAFGGVKALAGVAAVTGTEAAAQSAGMYLSDVALGDRELTAEGVAGALGRGFLFGSVAGGAAFGLEKGTIAARKLFSRVAEGGKEAGSIAEATWARVSEDVFNAGEETASIAKKRLAEIKLAKEEAGLAKAKSQAELAQAKLERYRAAPAESGAPAPVEAPAPPGEAPTTEPAAPAPTSAPAPTAAPAPATPPSPSAVPAAAEQPTALERQLQEMKGQIDSGKTLPELNAARTAKPARSIIGPDLEAEEQRLAEAVTNFDQRKAAVDAWIAKYKNPRVKWEAEWSPGGAKSGGMPVVRARSNTPLAEDVIVEQSGGQPRVIGKGAGKLEDFTPNTRILAASNHTSFEAGTALDEAYNDAINRARLAETPKLRKAALDEAADVEHQIHHELSGNPQNKAVIDRIEEVRKGADRTGYHAAFARMERRAMDAGEAAEAGPWVRGSVHPEEEAAYQATLAGRAQPAGKPYATGQAFVDETHEAAQVLGAYEKAHAELTEAVGELAPQSSKEAAAAYREAEQTAERKTFDRTSRAVDDHAEATAKTKAEEVVAGKESAAAPPITEPAAPAASGPAGSPTAPTSAKAPKGGQGPAFSDAQRKRLAEIHVETAESDLAAKKLANETRMAKLREPVQAPAPKLGKAKDVPATDAPAAAPAGKTKTGKALDALTLLEAANTVGIPGLPKPEDIPIVGPLLGLYLKFRAIKALAGKLGGRIPATGEAKAAALASKTKDKVATSIDRMLGLVERSAPAARTVAASGVKLEEALSRRMFESDDHEPTKGSLVELAAARAREIHAAAANPQQIIAHVREQMAGVSDPDLIAAAEQQQVRKFQYLASVAPKEPPPNPFVKAPWTTTPTEAAVLARRLQVADNPHAVFDQIEAKCLTPEAAETLRNVSPKLFQMAQQRLVERAADLQTTVPYQQRCRMALLFNVGLDPSLVPARIASLQTAHLPAPATNSPAAPTQQSSPPTPSLASTPNLTALVQPAADRLASRR